MKEKKMIKCEWFDYVSDEMLKMIRNGLELGFRIESQQYGTRYMVELYQK